MKTPDQLLADVAATRPTPIAQAHGWWTEADVLAVVAARDEEWIEHLKSQIRDPKEGASPK